jgi:PAS domain S-box-containing protein
LFVGAFWFARQAIIKWFERERRSHVPFRGEPMPSEREYDKPDGQIAVREAQEDLERKRTRIASRVAAAQLAHELAHEINNPLEALTNLIYIMKGSAVASGQCAEMLDEADHQLSRISRLVHSILSLGADGKLRIEHEGWLPDKNVLHRYKRDYEAALHLASIVESAQDAIYSKKLDGTIMAWNTGAERIFGYTTSEALGCSIRMLIPRDMPDDEWVIMQKLRRGERLEHYETVRLTKNGKRVRVSISVSPIFNRSGKVVGASTIAREIHDCSDGSPGNKRA